MREHARECVNDGKPADPADTANAFIFTPFATDCRPEVSSVVPLHATGETPKTTTIAAHLTMFIGNLPTAE
jgi:hypothetical protein